MFVLRNQTDKKRSSVMSTSRGSTTTFVLPAHLLTTFVHSAKCETQGSLELDLHNVKHAPEKSIQQLPSVRRR